MSQILNPDELEVVDGFAHENLEGWIPALASDAEVHEALEKAFDYRGDITLTFKSGERVEGYIFNRITGKTLADSFVQYFPANAPDKRKARTSRCHRRVCHWQRHRRRQEFRNLGQKIRRQKGGGREEHCAGS